MHHRRTGGLQRPTRVLAAALLVAIVALAARGGPCVAVLWGADARRLKPLLDPIPSVESAHQSPLSAYRGFIGSRPFSRVNALLVEQGGTAVDWTLPEQL